MKEFPSAVNENIGKNEAITFVCGADDKFAMPLAVTLFSALVNLNPSVVPVLYIIDGGISANNKQKIEGVLNNSKRRYTFHWVPFDLTKLSSVRETNYISKAAYLRIFIPELLPANVSKVIYLDCDMIVEADFLKLWELDFDQEPAMGVQDFCFPFLSSPGAISDFQELDLPPDAPYCNSGLMVLNLDYWRANHYSSQIFEYLNSKGDRLCHFDQDGINVAIGGKWKLLDPRWNVTLSSIANFGKELKLNEVEIQRYSHQFRQEPFVIHFTSRHKPWHSGKGNKEALTGFYYDQAFINRFFYYLKKSKWFTPATYAYWKNYRKAVLLFEFKIPRRISLLTSQQRA